MTDYRFYTGLLRFVAAKADPRDTATAAVMAHLAPLADEIDRAGGVFTVAPADLATTARAFAGVAGFLQKQILPEAVAHGHAEVERRLRWSVDASMEAVRILLVHAAEGAGQAVTVRLPPLSHSPEKGNRRER